MTVSLIIRLRLTSVFLFPLMAQPLSLGLAIIVSTIFICIIVAMFISSWYGFILFLIYVGGLLVIFAYVATLSPNILFGGAFPRILFIVFQLVLPASIYITSFIDFGFIAVSFSQHVLPLLKSCGIELVSPNIISILVSLALILLVNLIVVVKICYYQQRALRPYDYTKN